MVTPLISLIISSNIVSCLNNLLRQQRVRETPLPLNFEGEVVKRKRKKINIMVHTDRLLVEHFFFKTLANKLLRHQIMSCVGVRDSIQTWFVL